MVPARVTVSPALTASVWVDEEMVGVSAALYLNLQEIP